MSKIERFRNYIGGQWQEPSSGAYYKNINPAQTKELIGLFPDSDRDDVDSAVGAAHKAATEWASVPGPERGVLLYRFADLLEKNKVELARIITLEQGKAVAESLGEVGRAIAETRFIAGEASRLEGRTLPSDRRDVKCYTAKVPLGTVAAITPWNFPVVTPVRKLVPALACGNTVVFKPASLTPWTAVFLVELFIEAGIPDGVINLVIGKGSSVGQLLTQSPLVDGISFTGSTVVGRSILELAARRMAKVQLELGGKNPAVVFDFPDLEAAAGQIVSSAFMCSGQRCTAISRVIVNETESDGLIRHLLDKVMEIRVGPGLVPETTMGPLVSETQLRQVEKFVNIGLAEGAKLLAGGHRLVGGIYNDGYYFEPTLLDKVRSDDTIAQEEIFGPVLPIIRVQTFEEALAVANNTCYGLAAALFTERIDFAHAFADRIQAGMIHINHGTASQAHVPFGGIKSSGYGSYSIGYTNKDFFMNDKVVYIAV